MTAPITASIHATDYPLVLRAIAFAARAHAEQRRRYGDEPYLFHLLSVARRVAEYTTDPHVIAAAVLHDTVEDTSTSLEVLSTEFGARVAGYVAALTDTSPAPGLNRAGRKALDRERLATAPAEVQLIKVADLLDNAPSIAEYDPDFARLFAKEMGLLLDRLTSVDEALRAEARTMLDQFRASLD